jgi:hypothetical protein
MTFKKTLIEHQRSAEATAWLAEEAREQEERYRKICREMDAIEEQRERWYQEFLARIQVHGFNVDGDLKVKIAAEDIPVRPPGPHKVVY